MDTAAANPKWLRIRPEWVDAETAFTASLNVHPYTTALRMTAEPKIVSAVMLTEVRIGEYNNIEHTYPRRVAFQSETSAQRWLSATFWSSLVDFLGWDENWDGLGASKITMRTATQAALVAELALEIASEPFVAPAGDGSLMLEWELPNGAVVGVFIPGGDDEAWEAASVTRNEQVVEHDIRSAPDLVDLLRRAAAEA